MTDFTDLIGREDINDVEAILLRSPNTEVDAVVPRCGRTRRDLQWDYETQPPALMTAVRRRTSQWNGETDLPWEIDVDQEKVVLANATRGGTDGLGDGRSTWAAPRSQGGRRQGVDREFGIEFAELEALAVHARRAGSAPVRPSRRDGSVDRCAMLLRATQVMDEARHVEGVRQVPRHLKFVGHYPIRRTFGCCSTTSSPTPAGTSRTSGCRS